jgi:NDP-sugar pyrophosphorylase family protein
MKALLLCPSPRPAVAALAAPAPLATVPLLGASLLEYWLVHLAALGAREVIVLAADRFEAVQRAAGDGARWGLRVDVRPEPTELTIDEARARYCGIGASGWLPAPDDIVLLDHLPGLPDQCVFENYASWFVAAQTWMVRALTPLRVGVREIQPGVRVGLHSHVPRDAVFTPPCWIGENVFLGAGVRLGPMTVVEDRAFLEGGAQVSRSVIGPETFVGGPAEVRNAIAWGDTLIDWQSDLCERIPDSFLLSPLRPAGEPPPAPNGAPSRTPAPPRLLTQLRRLFELASQARRGTASPMPPP